MIVTRDLHHSQFNEILNRDGMILLQQPKEEDPIIYVMGIIET